MSNRTIWRICRLEVLSRCCSVIHHGNRPFRFYCTTPSALLLDDHHLVDESRQRGTYTAVDEILLPRTRVLSPERGRLFPVVCTVLKTLNWTVAWKTGFCKAVEIYGLDHSIIAFRIKLHIFTEAQMGEEVYALLRDIVCYFREVNLDMYELFPVLLDSFTPKHVSRSAYIFDVLIKVFAANSMLENALDVFEQAKRIGLVPNIRSCNFLVKCLIEAGRADTAIYLFDNMKESGPVSNIHTYVIMLNLYSSGDFEKNIFSSQVLQLLDYTLESGISLNVVASSTIIKGLCRLGCVEMAVDYIKDAQQKGLPLNNFCFNGVIQGFCQKGDLVKALKCLEDMKIYGLLADCYSYSILIDGFCKNGNCDRGLSLLNEMEHEGIKPSMVTYSSILYGLNMAGRIDESLEILHLRTSGYKYDNAVFDIFINGFSNLGKVDSAEELFQEMIEHHNIVPNSFNYNSLIYGFCKNGQFDKAVEKFFLMQKNGITPDTVTYNVIADSYCRQGQVEEALQLIDEMIHRGISPNSYTYAPIVKKLCEEGQVENAKQCIPLLLKKNILSRVMCCIVMYGFMKQSKFDEARRFYKKMRKLCISPDRVTYLNCIQMLCSVHEVRKAYRVFGEMQREGLNLDVVSYTSLIAGFCRVGRMNKAKRLFSHMKKQLISPNVYTYNSLIDGSWKQKRMDEVEWLFREMKSKKVYPNAVTYTLLISGYLKVYNFAKVRGIVYEMEDSGVPKDDFLLPVLDRYRRLIRKDMARRRWLVSPSILCSCFLFLSLA